MVWVCNWSLVLSSTREFEVLVGCFVRKELIEAIPNCPWLLCIVHDWSSTELLLQCNCYWATIFNGWLMIRSFGIKGPRAQLWPLTKFVATVCGFQALPTASKSILRASSGDTAYSHANFTKVDEPILDGIRN
jgi:hypothetical protein